MSIQNSDAALKVAQEQPLSGMVLAGMSGSIPYLFESPSFILGTNGSSGARIEVAGTPTVSDATGFNTIAYLQGSLVGLNVTAASEDVPNSSSLFSASVDLIGTTTTVSARASGASVYSSGAVCNITLDQIDDVALNAAMNNSGNAGGQIVFTVQNVINFTLASCTGENVSNAYTGINQLVLNLAAATNISLTDWTNGLGFNNDGMNLILNCGMATALTLPSSLANLAGLYYESDRFIGPLDAATVNAILAMYVASNPYSILNLVIGGSSASPTGQGLIDKATLISNGNSVSTN